MTRRICRSRVGGRAKAALAQLAGNLRKDLAVRPALGLQRQVAPADEVVDGFIEECDDFVDHPRGFGRAQSTRADEVRNQLAEFGLIRHGRAVCLGRGHGPNDPARIRAGIQSDSLAGCFTRRCRVVTAETSVARSAGLASSSS